MRYKLSIMGMVLIILAGLVLLCVVPIQQNNTTNNTTTVNDTGINATALQNEFNRIAALPAPKYMCREKSDLLVEYIHKQDMYASVKTVSVTHKNGKEAHVFVIYNGHAFDANSIPPLFNQTMDKYQQNLDIWGFNGYTVSTGYN